MMSSGGAPGSFAHHRALRQTTGHLRFKPKARPLPAARPRKKKKATRLDARTLAALRYAARCAYVSDAEGLTLAQMARREEMAGVGLPRLRAWAQEGEWEVERAHAREQLRHRSHQRLCEGLLRQSQRQMVMLAHIHDEAATLRRQQAVQPRSWESVANVQLKAAALMHQWQRQSAEMVAKLAVPVTLAPMKPGQAQTSGLAGVDIGDWSDEEAQAGAHHVLRQRMQARLSSPQNSAEDAEHVDDEQPPAEPVPLRVAAGH